MTTIRDVRDQADETSGGDLISSEGLDRIMAKAIRILLQDQGELIHRPDLGAGLRNLANKPPSRFELDRAYNAAARTLGAMEEIQAHEISLTLSGSTLTFDLSIEVNGATLTRRNIKVI